MALDAIFFYLFAALTLGGALATVTRRNPIHSAVSLVVSLLGVAGLYLLQQAEFLFAVQLILYVGGVVLLFLFVIFLVNLDLAIAERQYSRQWRGALAVGSLLALGIALLFRRGVVLPAVRGGMEAVAGNTEQVGESLLKDYLAPFEAASVLLLAAVVGAVLMAKRRES